MKNYDNKQLYTSGDFAKLIGINKRTLHYYNDIGLFKPDFIASNGYHYYSVYQFPQLETILMLRRIGLSIEEIQQYFTSPSDESYTKMISEKKKLIDISIQRLLDIKSFLDIKSKRLEFGLKCVDQKIEIRKLEERRLILSSPLKSKDDENDVNIAADFSLSLKKKFNLYDTFGKCISVENIINGNYLNYECFYAYCNDKCEDEDVILSEGEYLMAYNMGELDKIPHLYEKIKTYAKQNNITLLGYAYEERLNDFTLQRKNDYYTLITIPIKRI